MINRPHRIRKHCFHEMSCEQRGEDYRCCFCNVPKTDYDKSGHGQYYTGMGRLVDRSNEDCPVRTREA
jgi:hypothetical protein